MKIGVFGGAFSPAHIEHKMIAECAVTDLKLDKLLVIPTFHSPHKSESLSYADRKTMAEFNFKDLSHVEVCDIERDREGKSYTVDTLEILKAKIPDDDIFLIIGGDSLFDFELWYKPERIAKLATLVVAVRGDEASRTKEQADFLVEKYDATIKLLSFSGQGFSSTYLRYLILLDCSVGEYLTDEVYAYIKDKELYRTVDKEHSDIVDYIKSHLKEERRRHTAGVVEYALKLNKQLYLDESKVIISALSHDVAKYTKASDYPNFSAPDGVTEPVLHAFLGAYMLENVFGITDAEIIGAVRYHSTGKAEMTRLEQLIFVSDLLERGRNYPSVGRLRASIENDFDEGFRDCVADEWLHLVENTPQNDICPLSKEMYDYYCK